MASTKSDHGQSSRRWAWLRRVRKRVRKVEDRIRRRLPPTVNDIVSTDLIVGSLLGAGAGVWAIKASAVEGTEGSDLIALAQAAVGLLAITLAVMALLISFLSDRTERLIKAAGSVRDFFRPFAIIAIVSALSVLASVAGAIDASSVHVIKGSVVTHPGPTWFAVTLFGVAIWFFVWAVIGLTQLVRIFIGYGEMRSRLPQRRRSDAARSDALTLVSRQLSSLKGGTPPTQADLNTAVTNAPESTRIQIFEQAEQTRRDNRERNPAEMALTIPVFRALNAADPAEQHHRSHGSLGWALKDQPNAGPPEWQAAVDELTTAIRIRDSHNVSGWKLYEANRALCNIRLLSRLPSGDPGIATLTAQIRQDLAAAETDVYARPMVTAVPGQPPPNQDIAGWRLLNP